MISFRSFVASSAATATALLTPLMVGAQAGQNPLTVAGTRNASIRTTSGLQGSSDLPTMIGKFVNVALSILGVLLLCYLLYAGFLWMTSDGDKGADEAKKLIKNAVIGLIIIVSAFALSNFILTSLVTATA